MDIPDDGALAGVLEQAENYILVKDGETVGWLGLVKCLDGLWTLDMAIRPEWQGKWATRDLLMQIATFLFTPDRQFLVLHAKRAGAVKLALRMGAKPYYDGAMNCGVYILSKDNYFNGRLA
ncbi:hypothetical protein [Mesorhizobium sp. B2-3-4]|uniref:GNAT family N-acetyltransferase n=1 Tax=Mesorhizobium sp. B2-3-4 TaxID=2589959 RepID=UPI0011264525|nr:hypothetical protein [Mesorhizobium sp. B2-3-4]TPM41421.1 hypothetical protein FJ967_00340 [Mesorhizobium sp. B2-3-4]